MRFLSTPSGEIDLPDADSDVAVADKILRLLVSEPWVRLQWREAPDVCTRWTVMERDSSGIPSQICTEEFDGSVDIVSNDPDQRPE